MKVFLFASFKVPTGSMEPTILPGDFVLVNKLLIGPRIYQNIGFLKGKKTPYKRIKGMRQIRRNDLVWKSADLQTGNFRWKRFLKSVK